MRVFLLSALRFLVGSEELNLAEWLLARPALTFPGNDPARTAVGLSRNLLVVWMPIAHPYQPSVPIRRVDIGPMNREDIEANDISPFSRHGDRVLQLKLICGQVGRAGLTAVGLQYMW